MLGDRIGQALALAGVTEERVSRWLGRPCDCGDRRDRLNALDIWARRVVAGRTERAGEYLRELLEGWS